MARQMLSTGLLERVEVRGRIVQFRVRRERPDQHTNGGDHQEFDACEATHAVGAKSDHSLCLLVFLGDANKRRQLFQ